MKDQDEYLDMVLTYKQKKRQRIHDGKCRALIHVRERADLY